MGVEIEWANGSGSPARVGNADWVKAPDHVEVAREINRRRRLVYAGENSTLDDDFLATKFISAAKVAALRNEFAGLLSPAGGCLGGDPPTPTSMRWLWPEADADENKPLTAASPPPSGEVNFFAKMNGGTGWTDSLSGVTFVRAVHTNELRWACEKLSRGRWEVPIYWPNGIFSAVPDSPWTTDAIGNNGTHELRSIGAAVIITDPPTPLGPADVTVRTSSKFCITADVNCTVEIYRCKRPIDFYNDLPTWNTFAPSVPSAWETPGCGSAADRAFVGSLSLTAGVEGTLTGSAVAGAIQAMIDGEPQNFMVRRSDTDWATITITGRLVADFDLDLL
jgi:hypothetical protein